MSVFFRENDCEKVWGQFPSWSSCVPDQDDITNLKRENGLRLQIIHSSLFTSPAAWLTHADSLTMKTCTSNNKLVVSTLQHYAHQQKMDHYPKDRDEMSKTLWNHHLLYIACIVVSISFNVNFRQLRNHRNMQQTPFKVSNCWGNKSGTSLTKKNDPWDEEINDI